MWTVTGTVLLTTLPFGYLQLCWRYFCIESPLFGFADAATAEPDEVSQESRDTE